MERRHFQRIETRWTRGIPTYQALKPSGSRGHGQWRAGAHSNENHRCDSHCCLPFFRPLIYPPTSMQRSARWRDLSRELPISATQFSMGDFKNVLATIQSTPSVARSIARGPGGPQKPIGTNGGSPRRRRRRRRQPAILAYPAISCLPCTFSVGPRPHPAAQPKPPRASARPRLTQGL